MTSFVGHAEYVGNTGALPAGVQPGDLAVVFTYCATSSVVIGGATGWANGPDYEPTGNSMYVALRMLNGTENETCRPSLGQRMLPSRSSEVPSGT